MRSRVFALAVAAGVLGVCGCGGPQMASVKGRVMYDGKPVAEAAVMFAPQAASAEIKEPGKAGTGFTDADGRFELSSYSVHDGAIVGPHKVTVSIDDTNKAKCGRMKILTLEVKPGTNEFTIEMDPPE